VRASKSARNGLGFATPAALIHDVVTQIENGSFFKHYRNNIKGFEFNFENRNN
jgi:hypothetical protein